MRVSAALAALGLLAALAVACTSASGQAEPTETAGAEPTPSTAEVQETPTIDYTGEFSLSPAQGPIGTEVQATGSGFDADTDLQVVWQGFNGSWNTDGAEFLGREYTESAETLATVRTDASGAFETTFTVPEGFGFLHDVLVMQDDEIRNKAAFEVEMEVSISPTSGPVGTPITIEARGIGWRPLENSWDLLYDNKFTGWLSAVTTDGSARAVIPATGQPGKHVLQVLHGSFTFPYMNMQQSPQPDRPTWTLEFTVTDRPPVLPPPPEEQGMPVEAGSAPPAGDSPQLWSDPTAGPVDTPVTLHGAGFDAGQEVELLWYRVIGNRVSGEGWDESSSSLGSATAEPDGTFSLQFDALDDLGGDHRIEAQDGGDVVAETTFTTTPSAFALEPSSGPAGTTVTVHVKGVGWTETANIYTAVYDNAYLGYSCGFNSQGDITVNLPAAGEPGWHFIDLYPAIYKGEDMKRVNNFRIPQLTYEEDHPGERLPAFRFAFEVTE